MLAARRVKLAYCIDSFAIGGTELNAVRTAEALDPKHFDLRVIHLQADGPLLQRYRALGVEMLHLPISSFYTFQTARQGFQLTRILRRWNIEVLHTHDVYTNIFAVPWARALSDCRILASRRWWKATPRAGLGRLNRYACRFADRILANSSSVAAMLIAEDGVPHEKVVEIPNFVEEHLFDDVSELARAAQREAWGVPKGAFVVGSVARLAPIKNHALLIGAVATLATHCHLVLVGDGPSRGELQRLVDMFGINARVHFVGAVLGRTNWNQFFDVSVLCSTSEAFPNSILEALAAARPVVATRVGGIVDVVSDEQTGLLLQRTDDREELARLLNRLESDTYLRRKLGEAGRHMVRTRFHRDAVIERLSSLYRSMAEDPPLAIERSR
ncbi:MAG: glycosyltransferase [Gammaproteobacteria bacterium]